MGKVDMDKIDKFIEMAVENKHITRRSATALHFFVKMLRIAPTDWETMGENNEL